MTARRAAVLVMLGTVFALPEWATAQCPMCRQALMSVDAQGLAAAFQSGILFLLAAPFVVFGTVATMAIRTSRRRVQRHESGPSANDQEGLRQRSRTSGG